MTVSKACRLGLVVLAWVLTLVGVSAVTLFVERTLTSSSLEETRWFKCTHVNMDIIRERIAQAMTDHPEWISDISITFLVRKGYLPEWSEIYICPADFQVTFDRARVFGEDFRRNLQENSLVAAYYTNASYHIEITNGMTIVRCRSHTTVVGYSYLGPSSQHK